MASKLQLARGSLVGKQNNTPLIPSELFWVARTSDENNANNEFSKWDEGTLYIGRPSINLARENEKPVPIAGARNYFSLVNRGFLNAETSIQDFILLLIIENGGDGNINKNGNIIDHSKIKYKRINSSGGYADDVYFTQNGKEDGEKWVDFDATNVQDALLELNWEKLQYIGTIGTNSQIPAKPIIGGLYLIVADQLSFNVGKVGQEFSPDKGDFVYWRQPVNTDITTGIWVQIPSGYTNADEIDYYDHDDNIDIFINGLFNTFKSSHINQFKNASGNVRNMLDFLMAHKAQLDEQGKIPLSQLHDTVLGALQFRGTWNPLMAGIPIQDAIRTVDGKQYVKPDYINFVNKLPGFIKMLITVTIMLLKFKKTF